jgi:hypothetical protein
MKTYPGVALLSRNTEQGWRIDIRCRQCEHIIERAARRIDIDAAIELHQLECPEREAAEPAPVATVNPVYTEEAHR